MQQRRKVISLPADVRKKETVKFAPKNKGLVNVVNVGPRGSRDIRVSNDLLVYLSSFHLQVFLKEMTLNNLRSVIRNLKK